MVREDSCICLQYLLVLTCLSTRGSSPTTPPVVTHPHSVHTRSHFSRRVQSTSCKSSGMLRVCVLAARVHRGVNFIPPVHNCVSLGPSCIPTCFQCTCFLVFIQMQSSSVYFSFSIHSLSHTRCLIRPPHSASKAPGLTRVITCVDPLMTQVLYTLTSLLLLHTCNEGVGRKVLNYILLSFVA